MFVFTIRSLTNAIIYHTHTHITDTVLDCNRHALWSSAGPPSGGVDSDR